MLIRSSSEVRDGFFLLTLGSSCHYLVGDENFTLFDGCYSAQIPLLLSRLEQFGVKPASLNRIFATHLHADRIAGIPYLRKSIPNLSFGIFSKTESQLRERSFVQALYERDLEILKRAEIPAKPAILEFEEFFALLAPDVLLHDGDTLALSNGDVARVVPFPGHTSHSVAFLFQSAQFLITDEGCGYFNLNGLHAPGGDTDLGQAISSILKLAKLDLRGICLPSGGVITGTLTQRYLQTVVRNSSDILTESKAALADGVALEDIRSSIFESFYKNGLPDAVSQLNRKETFDALWTQIRKKIT